MNEARKLLLSTGSQILSRALTVILGLITIGVLTRSLGPDGYGQYTTIFALINFVGIIIDLGMYLVITRRIGAGEDPSRIVSAVLGLRLASFLGILAIVALLSIVLPYDPTVKFGIILGAISLLGITLNQALGGLFQAKQRMDLFVIGDVLGRLITLGLVIFIVARGWGLIGAVWAVILGYAANLAVTWYFARPFARLTFAIDRPLWRELFAEALPVGVLITLGLVYLRADVVILSLLKPASDVGIYGIASKVSEIISTVPLIIMAAMLPLLSRAAAFGDTARLRASANQIFQLMLLLAAGLAVGTPFVANKIAALLGGQDFTNAGLPLAIVMVAVGFGFFTAFYSHLMIAYGKQRRLVLPTTAVAVLNIAFNFALIPRYGYLAAAWTTVFSEALIVGWYGYEVSRAIGYRPHWPNTLKLITPLGLLVLALVLLKGSPVLVSIIISVIIFVGSALLLRAVPYQELAAIFTGKD